MKKVLVILSVCMLLPMSSFAQKLGHINSRELIQLMPEVKAVSAKLDTITKQYEEEFLKMRQEYESKIKEYQANVDNMAQSIREMRESEIADLGQRIELFNQTAQQDLQKQQNTLMEPIFKKFNDALEAVGKENGYTYIFDSAAMLYISENADDVQPLVKVKLGIK